MIHRKFLLISPILFLNSLLNTLSILSQFFLFHSHSFSFSSSTQQEIFHNFGEKKGEKRSQRNVILDTREKKRRKKPHRKNWREEERKTLCFHSSFFWGKWFSVFWFKKIVSQFFPNFRERKKIWDCFLGDWEIEEFEENPLRKKRKGLLEKE